MYVGRGGGEARACKRVRGEVILLGLWMVGMGGDAG